MTWYTVTIVFTDGTTEEVEHVTEVTLDRNSAVLSLGRYQGNLGRTLDLGQFPLANIRKWTRVEQ